MTGTALRDALTTFSRNRRRWKRVALAERAFFATLLRLGPGDIAVDCGANRGFYTHHMARSGASVHAFEPDPTAFAALQSAVGHLPNVTLHKAAVGVGSGTGQLRRAEDFAADPLARSVASSLVAGGTGEAFPVQIVDFAAFLEGLRTPPALVKLDIEGSEVDILETLLASGRIDRLGEVYVETHERQFPALRARTYALIRTLAARPAARVNLDWG